MKEWKKLSIIYLSLVFIKILIGSLIKSPLGFGDSYLYIATAKSLFFNFSLFFDGVKYMLYPPLYSIFLFWTYLFKDMATVFFTMKVINSFLLTACIFPIYYLSKEFLSKKKALMVTLISAFVPPFFSFSNYVLSENLFYPLILFSVYFLYKSCVSKKWSWDVLTGIFIGLSYLAKMNTIVILPIVFLIPLYFIVRYKDYSQIKKKILLLMFSFVVVSPWLLRNVLTYGLSLKGILGRYIAEVPGIEHSFNLFSRGYWTLLYTAYLTIGSYLVFLPLSLKLLRSSKKKVQILTFILLGFTFFSLLLSGIHSGAFANWADSRPLGRYMAFTIPLILILGMVSLKEGFKFKVKDCFILMLFFVITSSLLNFKLFPLNNMSLSYLGVMIEGLSYFGLSIIYLKFLMVLSPLLMLFLIKKKYFLHLILIFTILIALLNTSIVYYDSNYRWYDQPASEFGRYVDSAVEPDKLIVFDEKEHLYSENYLGKEDDKDSLLYAMQWVRNEVVVGNDQTEGDYFVSVEGLNVIN